MPASASLKKLTDIRRYQTIEIPALDPDSCVRRRERLATLVDSQSLDAALITNRGFVHALTGYWHRQPLTPVGLVLHARSGAAQGNATLIVPENDRARATQDALVDNILTYTAITGATLGESLDASLMYAADPALGSATRIGVCGSAPVATRPDRSMHDIAAAYQRIRRAKDADELALLRAAIRAAEATYVVARRSLEPGVLETELHAAMLAEATGCIGEALSGWGNDFQSGSIDGTPRRRPIESGELAIFDIGVGVRGYRSDLCRTFSVGGVATDEQRKAHAHIVDTLTWLEDRMGPGVTCSSLFAEAHERLQGWNGCVFPHHLGHGIGLDAHEVPRLNPAWDDVLAVGDVIAVEPGVYAPTLRAGIRLEHNYVVTEDGVERLSRFPLDL